MREGRGGRFKNGDRGRCRGNRVIVRHLSFSYREMQSGGMQGVQRERKDGKVREMQNRGEEKKKCNRRGGEG